MLQSVIYLLLSLLCQLSIGLLTSQVPPGPLCQSQQPEFGLTFNVEAETGAVLRKKAVPAQSVVTTQWCPSGPGTRTSAATHCQEGVQYC